MRKKASFKRLPELSEMSGKSGADPEILEKGGRSMSVTMVGQRRKF